MFIAVITPKLYTLATDVDHIRLSSPGPLSVDASTTPSVQNT